MVELVDAADSKSAGFTPLRVQVSLPVPENIRRSRKATAFFRLSSGCRRRLFLLQALLFFKYYLKNDQQTARHGGTSGVTLSLSVSISIPVAPDVHHTGQLQPSSFSEQRGLRVFRSPSSRRPARRAFPICVRLTTTFFVSSLFSSLAGSLRTLGNCSLSVRAHARLFFLS